MSKEFEPSRRNVMVGAAAAAAASTIPPNGVRAAAPPAVCPKAFPAAAIAPPQPRAAMTLRRDGRSG